MAAILPGIRTSAWGANKIIERLSIAFAANRKREILAEKFSKLRNEQIKTA